MVLSMLSRYYYHELGYGKQKIVNELDSFMNKNYPRYNSVNWTEYIEKCANHAKKYPLCECTGVWITSNELKTIESIHNKVVERLAFTLLCLAKFKNFRNPENNGWVNNEDSEIYKLACITTTAFDKGIRFCQLKEFGLIKYAKKINNLNVQVLFINDESDKKLFIDDFRKLGYEWRLYKGENYIRCADCGILVRKTSTNRKYCNDCAKQNPYYDYSPPKIIQCKDCGKDIKVDASSRKVRCDECFKKERSRINSNYRKKTSSF